MRHNNDSQNYYPNNFDDPCLIFDTPYLEIRYYLIGVVGFIFCSLGIFFNIVLLKILLQPTLRTTYLIYLSALAIIDINIAVTYVVVMSVAMWYEYYSSFLFYHVWHACLPYFFTLSRIVTLASTYLVVACTAERYLEVVQLYTRRSYVRITHTKRYVVIACVILASVAFRLVVFWELNVETMETCRGTFAYYVLNRTWLVYDYYYSKVYTFYALHVVQVFFPFVALLLLNFSIVRKWRVVLRRDTIIYTTTNNDDRDEEGDQQHLQDRQALTENRDGERSEQEEMRKRVKCAQSARKMMAAIVTSYLICNLLNLTLTFLEHLDITLLQNHSDFYGFASDTVTLLTAVNATVRLPIYYACNLKIRSEVTKMLRQCARTTSTKSKASRRRASAIVRVRRKRNNQNAHTSIIGDVLDAAAYLQGMSSEMTPLWNRETRPSNGHRIVDENEVDV